MSVRAAVTLVLLARLALASAAIAQVADQEDEPPRPPVSPRIEIGATAGATIGLPDLGLIGSIPLDSGASFDILVSHMPRVWNDTSHVLAQGQFRIPFRRHLRSRRSFLLGVTRIGSGGRRRVFGDYHSFTRPHAGASFQWPISRGADIRFDVQGVFTFARDMPTFPRAMTAIVWHTKPAPRVARRAARGRS